MAYNAELRLGISCLYNLSSPTYYGDIVLEILYRIKQQYIYFHIVVHSLTHEPSLFEN
jgi:hypothetical protein